MSTDNNEKNTEDIWKLSEETIQKQKREKEIIGKLDIVFGIFLIILGIAYFVSAFRMPRGNIGGNFGGSTLALSPGLLPMFVSAVLILLSIVMILQSIKEGSRITKEDMASLKQVVKKPSFRRTLLIILIIAIYAFVALELLPYTIATFLYLVVFMFCFKAGSLPKILIVSLIVTVLLWFFFGKIALIPLP